MLIGCPWWVVLMAVFYLVFPQHDVELLFAFFGGTSACMIHYLAAAHWHGRSETSGVEAAEEDSCRNRMSRLRPYFDNRTRVLHRSGTPSVEELCCICLEPIQVKDLQPCRELSC